MKQVPQNATQLGSAGDRKGEIINTYLKMHQSIAVSAKIKGSSRET